MSDYWDPNGIVQSIDKTIKQTGQKTEVVLNEYIPFITDWCNCTGLESLCGNNVLPANCPDWQAVSTGGGYANHDLTKMKGTYQYFKNHATPPSFFVNSRGPGWVMMRPCCSPLFAACHGGGGDGALRSCSLASSCCTALHCALQSLNTIQFVC